MKKRNYFAVIIVLFVLGASITLVQFHRKQSHVIATVDHYYQNNKGEIKSYGRNQHIEYLSESIGLYMDYLLMTKNHEEFDRQFKILYKYFVIDGQNTYVKWKLTKNTSTDALVDDLRLIDVLTDASHLFKDNKYQQLASKISASLLTKQKRNGALIDFYNWSTNEQANTLHLSYINISAFKKLNSISISTYKNDLEQASVSSSPFFLEIVNVDTKQYEKANTKSVNMIDQLLIALQYEEIEGKPPTMFDRWLRKEWSKQGKIYGQYNRTTLSPASSYESSAVYALATLYFIQQGDLKYAEQLHRKLLEQPPFFNKTMYSNIHFFDYIYSMIADYRYRQIK
ncbi:hypothetical protein G4D61_08995 [Bacillus ginsengihumi]|uniref:Glycosyl hydrolase family 8 n=1 Tax=Heyndrickxia ginsengihumi TaxID=363870 RepID=A0A0A6VH99_9BACI|nr:hypothetical protein [Heyndrickxia ginsengihumi]KHD86009.1 hypothetical protein NG54_05830 [Heyndrickxia ginsengihumi]MBE6182941.1 hypothetical protein [Bacillus sp. (in: firmicutes)]NEY20103.1 hypothetical protein [Heyndrickxia ginsengihumi]